jgi:phage shock protein B
VVSDLENLIGIALIVFLALPAPLFIVLYFITRWKQSREITGSDEQLLEELWNLSQRLEDRLQALETILDHEAPDWRKKT